MAVPAVVRSCSVSLQWNWHAPTHQSATSSACTAGLRRARSTSMARKNKSKSGCRRWRGSRKGRVLWPDRAAGGLGRERGMTTTAKREGDSWVINGQKRWIGNAPWCDLSIIWARDVADNQVKGFIVENKTTPGFSVEKIEHKI